MGWGKNVKRVLKEAKGRNAPSRKEINELNEFNDIIEAHSLISLFSLKSLISLFSLLVPLSSQKIRVAAVATTLILNFEF